jgi:Ca2+-binding RTX toxin-like protein
MTFSFGTNQLDKLTEARTDALASLAEYGRYAISYELVFAMISVDGGGTPIIPDGEAAGIDLETWSLSDYDTSGWTMAIGVDPGAWAFLRGVPEVNWGPGNPDEESDYSKFIREYTKVQFLTRFGSEASDEDVQAASDAIADNILADILSNHVLPDIDGIAEHDASAAAEVLFGETEIAGWAGNALLLPVGHDESFKKNIMHLSGAGGDGDITNTYDVLSVLHGMIVAADEIGWISSASLVQDVLWEVVPHVPGAAEVTAYAILDMMDMLKNVYGISWSSALVSSNIILGTSSSHGGLSGTVGYDLIHGGKGNDTVVGDGGSDNIDGGKGSDVLDGDAGHDKMWGGDDADTLNGQAGNDRLRGGTGSDLLDGGEGSDVLEGDVGDDTLQSGNDETSDILVGIAGSDTYQFAASDFGKDVIRDTSGTLRVGDKTLSGMADYTSGHWELTIEGELFSFYRLNNNLRIFHETESSDRITIEKFFKTTSGAFGFTLEGISHPASPHTKTGHTPPFRPKEDDPLAPPPAQDPGEDARGIEDRFGAGLMLTSPLVLDLGDDGFDIKGIDDVGVFFNLDADEPLEDTGWVGPDEGFLVHDANSNGNVDGISELFGDATTSGFEHLAVLDSNSDDAITSADTLWSSLRIWEDSDQDGQTDSGELQTLSYHGITSISLNYTDLEYWENGNKITQESTFTMSGAQKKVIDIWFETGQFNSIDDPDESGSASVDVETYYLPHNRGYGNFSSLRIAMTENETLMEMVSELADSDPADAGDWPDMVEAIMFEWAGVTAYATPRGYMADSRKLAFLEEMIDASGPASPGPNASAYYTALFDDFKEEMGVRLLVMGPLSDLFPDAVYDYETDTLTIETDPTALATRIDESEVEDEAYWASVLDIVAKHYPDMGLNVGQLYDFMDQLPEEKVGDYFGTRSVVGTGGADTLKGTVSVNYIQSLSGNDVLYGYDGDDILDGGAGNDVIYGGRGEDTYFFRVGDGQDMIHDSQGANVIAFESGITASEVRVVVVSDDVQIFYEGGGDKITVNAVIDTGNHDNRGYIEKMVFVDGTEIDLSEGLPLTGTGSSDTLDGTSGADTLQGGAGNDNLYGYAGNDSYVFQLGDGNDLINNDFAGTNAIQFASGIAAVDVRLMRGTSSAEDDLYVYYGSGGDKVTVNGQFNTSTEANNGYMNKVVLFDTTEIDLANNLWLKGTSSNEDVLGSSGADTLQGAAGNDTISGYGGNDGYYFQNGDGNDLITDTAGTNTLRFASGVTAGDVRLVRGTGGGEDDLFVFYNGGSDKVTVNGQFNTSTEANNGYMNKVVLFDTTEIDLAANLVLTGTSSNETVDGSSAADTLHGLAGNDLLRGYGGNDLLIGGAGLDTVTGSSGNDSILFDQSASGHADHITDFKSSGSDKIALSDAVFTFNSGDGSKNGVALTDNTDIYDVGTNFSSGGFSGAPGSGNGCTFLFDTTDRQLWYDADGNGAGSAVLIATVDNGYTYAASDFIGWA